MVLVTLRHRTLDVIGFNYVILIMGVMLRPEYVAVVVKSMNKHKRQTILKFS